MTSSTQFPFTALHISRVGQANNLNAVVSTLQIQKNFRACSAITNRGAAVRNSAISMIPP